MKNKILYLLALIITAHSVCNATHNYILPSTGVCYIQCPWNPPTKYYGYSVNWTCVTTCPGSYYGYDSNKTCITTCPTTPNLTFYDNLYKLCVNVCPANYFSYLGSNATYNQQCVSSCPLGTFAEFISQTCVSTCPVNTYYYTGSPPICTVRCPANFYGSPIDKKCYSGGSCPTAPVRYYADDTTNLCVLTCPNGYFADSTTGRCLIFCSINFFSDSTTKTCVSLCPLGYYRSNVTRSCLMTCSLGYYIDKSSLNCTQSCTSGSYGDGATGICQSTCTLPAFADPSVGLCVNVCSIGLFSNNYSQSCVSAANCYGNTVGDPTTNKCVNNTFCPLIPYYFADLVNKLCTTRCPSSYWGDKVSRLCLSACPWNPSTYISYKNPNIQECVTTCPEFPILYADNFSQSCVVTCPQSPTVAYNTYADSISQTCVRECPNGFTSDPTNYLCMANCTTTPTMQYFNPINSSCVTACPNNYFAETYRQICTTSCISSPSYFALSLNNSCVLTCPANYYADSSTRSCVEQCPVPSFEFASSYSNECVSVCPLQANTFGQMGLDGYRRCVSTCTVGTFADAVSRLCIENCDISKGYYGESTSPLRVCVLKCPANKYADNTSQQCVSTCPSSPKLYYGNPINQMCVAACPPLYYANSLTNLCVQPSACQTNYFADDSTNQCVAMCPITQSTFGDTLTRRCIKSCSEGYYADNTTRKCSSTCNSTANLYGDGSTKRCVTICPSVPSLYNNPLTMTCSGSCSGGYFAYDNLRLCMAMCPSTPPFWANLNTNRCVSSCPIDSYKYEDSSQRSCVTVCPQRIYTASFVVDFFADNSTWSCVPLCPANNNLYNFKHPTNASIRICVLTCPMVSTTYYFAENITQSCVTACPALTNLTYGDSFTLKCSKNCTLNQFRDNMTARCVYLCSPGYYADNTTWNCVQQCPQGYFAESTNRTCSLHCPTNYYADNETRFCRSLCDSELYLFSDNTTWRCMLTCPSLPDLYADGFTKKCSEFCSGGYFADSLTRTCLPALNCSNGEIGDSNSGRCVGICPIEVPSFYQALINQCVNRCSAGTYADNSTMECVAVCPSNPNYFAYNHSTLGPICLLYCPNTYYRHTITRQCITACPPPNYFQDTTTMTCQTSCPDHYFAETINQICILNCSINNKYGYNNLCYVTCPNNTNADPTTYLCVLVCPFGYFSQNGLCKTNCLNGFADPFTKMCANVCSLDYYALLPSRLCVQSCEPLFKYFPTQTCIANCPPTNNVSTNLYQDMHFYSCVNICMPGQYADNQTRSCSATCSSPLLADNSTGLCVSVCPSFPQLYGYNGVCYFPCPNSGLFAENMTRSCLTVCPNGSYADSFNWRCMNICTGTQYSYSNSTNNYCLAMCPLGYYGNNATKSCLLVCPNATFAENNTRVCIARCPTGTFADQNNHFCMTGCNIAFQQFADSSTNRCVKNCPSIPSLYAQDSTRSCVSVCQINWYTLNTSRICSQTCPAPFFADPITGDCATSCQLDYNLYADNVTRTCSPTCPNVIINGSSVNTYADGSTKRCVFQCPFFPSLYGVNASNICSPSCPALTFGDNDTRVCLASCYFGTFNGINKYTFADSTTNFCVYYCPANSYADNSTASCTNYCTLGSYADDSTWRCVYVCPTNPIRFGFQPNRTCIYHCPGTYFSDEVGRTCLLNTCPTTPSVYYRDFINHKCVSRIILFILECTFPYFGDINSQNCVTVCLFGYYADLGSHACTLCPSNCLSCLNALNCTACKTALYLFNGQCITTCPQFPIYYYAYNVAFSCVQVCPSPYFGFNGTGRCEISCPQTYYNDISTSACKSCPAGCTYCNVLNCTSCLTGYIYVVKYGSCSMICSTSAQFYIDGVCANTCIDGTFLLDDLVTCQKCSIQCSACAVSGNNCTKCSGKFWYNYNCVDQCPSSFYVDANNSCQQCTSNNTACKLPALTYTMNTFTLNYTLYANVTFNRDVNLTRDQFAQVARLSTQNGPLKSSSYTINKVAGNVYQLKFLASASLNELSLSLSFAPGSITDSFGNGLTTSVTTTQIATISTVSTATQTQTTSVSKQVNIVGWVLLAVLFVMMIKCSYPMIILIDLLQYIYMHIYVLATPLPYLYMFAISELKNINFMFLPVLYSADATPSDNPYSLFQTDTSFLANCQPFVFFLGIFGASYLLFWVLSLKWINRCKPLRKKIKQVFRKRMRFSFINQIFYYTQLYVIFFAVYQFKGSNSKMSLATTNLAIAILVLIIYLVWLGFITYIAVKYRNQIQKMPTKFQFLALEQSKFPMEIPYRYFHKILISLVLILDTAPLQLTLLLIFNFMYALYLICFRPSKNKVTNLINIFVCFAFMAYEIIIFMYSLSSKTSDLQNKYSIILLVIAGGMVAVIFIWICYRFVKYIREDCLGIKSEDEETPLEKSHDFVKSKENERVQERSKHASIKERSKYASIKEKDSNKDDNLNISELNIVDENDQEEDMPSINADQAIKQFTYHFVPAKTDGLLKHQNAILGIKPKTHAKHERLIISIDQDQLLNQQEHKKDNRPDPNHKRKMKSSNRQRKDHLVIEDREEVQLEEMQLKDEKEEERKSSSEESNYWTRKVKGEKYKEEKVVSNENVVIWDNINVEEHESERNSLN